MGCRCSDCRNAHRFYGRAWRIRRRPPLKVHAGRVREHLLELQQEGLGLNAVAAASNVGASTVLRIRQGSQQRVRRRTAQALLSVTGEAILDGALVPASPTVRLLRAAREEGYSWLAIAAVLGCAERTVPNYLYRQRVTARTALRVRRGLRRLGVQSM
jgi:DNA invertase Pin-like site-specific DNA recombinase